MEPIHFDGLSPHARVRMQQGGITQRALFCLLDYATKRTGTTAA